MHRVDDDAHGVDDDARGVDDDARGVDDACKQLCGHGIDVQESALALRRFSARRARLAADRPTTYGNQCRKLRTKRGDIRGILIELVHEGMITFWGPHLDRGEDVNMIVILTPIEIRREVLVGRTVVLDVLNCRIHLNTRNEYIVNYIRRTCRDVPQSQPTRASALESLSRQACPGMTTRTCPSS